ncbi:MAG: flagellar biosynthetic protein FliR [Limisphaerales bacterium]|jgi:flagellar biosynthetic protein FliR
MSWDLYIVWILGFLRASALMLVFPVFSSQQIPVRMRIALAGVTAFLIAPLIKFDVPALPSLLGLVGILSLEIMTGLLMGFICRMVFFTVQLAGSIIAFQMGLQMSSAIDPGTNSNTETPGLILYYLTALLFLALDMHHWVLAGFVESYTVLPVGAAGLGTALMDEGIAHTGRIFASAVQMSAPLLAVAFLITYVFALLGRTVPQMNVFSESFAARTLAGLIVFGLTVQLTAAHITNHLRRIPQDLSNIVHLLGSG